MLSHIAKFPYFVVTAFASFLFAFSACSSSSEPEDVNENQTSSSSAEADEPTSCPEKLGKNEICDSRDYKVYRTTEIGALIWTAENLRYEVEGSRCFENQDSNCVKFGRLYNWAQAMGFKAYYLRNTAEDSIHKPYHQGICMPGWHVPDTLEWKYLMSYTDIVDEDPYGFKILHSGFYSNYSFSYWDNADKFITATESDEMDYYVDHNQDTFFDETIPPSRVYSYGTAPKESSIFSDSKSHGYSLRCVKDTLLMEMVIPSSSSVESSSSAETPSSSSIEVSSSSVDTDTCASIQKQSWKYLNPDVEYEIFQDDRDGHCYKSVKIGEQVWMAENLNYVDSIAHPLFAGKTHCLGNDPDSCEIFGRFYSHIAAMKACPEGWHLPKRDEIKTLLENASDAALKSTEWPWQESSATNESGFSALPLGLLVDETGYCSNGGCDVIEKYFATYGELVQIWSQTLNPGYDDFAYYLIMWDLDEEKAKIDIEDRLMAMNVRCIHN
ncbi:FISUMP domain-containing protein [Fibrobacter sp.]|uniref:FISUMP domain-containing protein n=1 Tax=Fibrobacter sp. TaxID=35828 RepID=UPI00386D25CA